MARCGGHSYAGYSTTPGLMIDLGRLNRIDFNPATRIATIGGGTLSDWLDGFYAAMIKFATPGSYQNFPDPSLTNYLDSYYGINLPKLERVKAAVDPTCVFKYPQAIPPAAGCRA